MTLINSKINATDKSIREILMKLNSRQPKTKSEQFDENDFLDIKKMILMHNRILDGETLTKEIILRDYGLTLKRIHELCQRLSSFRILGGGKADGVTFGPVMGAIRAMDIGIETAIVMKFDNK